MVFSKIKSDILASLLLVDKSSVDDICKHLELRTSNEKHLIRVKIRELSYKGLIKRLHGKWHKPVQEYSLSPATRSYLEKRERGI